MTFLFFAGYSNNTTISGYTSDTNYGLVFFDGNWNDALEKAKDESKLIFLELHASWCNVCKRLKENTFTDREAGDLYNANFINMALDGEKGEGKVISSKTSTDNQCTL